MPKSTVDVLKTMVTEFRQVSEATGETLESFSTRKYQDLNEPIRLEDLERIYQVQPENAQEQPENAQEQPENAQEQPENVQEQPKIGLPEEFRSYLIIDASQWDKREAMSKKARQVKVDTKLIYEKRKPIKGPGIMGRSINESAYYLEKSEQKQLLEEYEELMSVTPDEERDRKIRIKHNLGRADAAQTEEQLKYERGHMLARLSEKYMDVKPTDLLKLTAEEKVKRMEEMEFIYAVACNLDTVLKGSDDILFSREDRLICEHMHSLMEVTGGFSMEYELMSNPCYKYLDLEKYFRDFDAVHIGNMGAMLTGVESDAISRLGMDFMMGAFRIQRQVGIRVEEELENRGFDLKNTKYTMPDNTELNPLSVEGLAYIAAGGTFFAKDSKHALKTNADMKDRLEITEIKPKDYAMPCIQKALAEHEITDSHVIFMKEDKTLWNPENPEDLEYFGKGNSVVATCGDKQVYVQYNRRSDSITHKYTKQYLQNEETRIENEANELIQQAQLRISRVEDANRTALFEHIQKAEQDIKAVRKEELKEIRLMLKRSDPILLKSSPEYRNVKRAMKDFSHLPQIDKKDPENIQRARELLGEALQNANTYLANKDSKATHSRTETSRMASVRRARDLAFNLLNRLNDMVRDMEEHQACLDRTMVQLDAISQQRERIKNATKRRLNSNIYGGSVPQNVRAFFEKKWEAEEKAAAEKANPSIPEVPPMPAIPPVPEEIHATDGDNLSISEEDMNFDEGMQVEDYIVGKADLPVEGEPEEMKAGSEKEKEEREAAEAFVAAEKKFSDFQDKLDSLTDEKFLIENESIIFLDMSIGEVADEKMSLLKHKDLMVTPDVDSKTPFSEKQEKQAKTLLADVILRRAIRNDQHAHPEHPEAGVIMQLSEKLVLPDYEYVVMETPTFKAMAEQLSRESLYDLVINLDTKQKPQILNIMNEIPATAKDLFAKRKISVAPKEGDNYAKLYRSLHGKDLYDKLDLEPEVKDEGKDKEAEPAVKVKEAKSEVKPAAKGKEAKPAVKSIGRQ